MALLFLNIGEILLFKYVEIFPFSSSNSPLLVFICLCNFSYSNVRKKFIRITLQKQALYENYVKIQILAGDWQNLKTITFYIISTAFLKNEQLLKDILHKGSTQKTVFFGG